MKTNKKILASLFVFSLLNIPETASASGIPTVDASAIAQAVLSLEQLKNTYAQIVQQYNQAVSTYQNFTGNRGLGMIFYNPELRQFLPNNFSSQCHFLKTVDFFLF